MRPFDSLRLRLWLLLLVGSLACVACDSEYQPPPAFAGESIFKGDGIAYWLQERKEPRPLRVHVARIDLSNPRIELAAVLADDPDGEGPATAMLESPVSMAARSGATLMVNANPWQSLPDAAGKRTTNWREGMPVEVLGLAATGGKARSAPKDDHCAFWLDENGKAHIGNPPEGATVTQAVAGFAQILRNGQVLGPEGGPIHPRTAVGLDASGRWLYLVVVDGRQAGYSEGMTTHELAVYLRGMGSDSAVNLDGGGSSIMILSRDGARRVVNDPSTKQNGVSVPRPIPVALVVRAKGTATSRPSTQASPASVPASGGR